MKTNEPSHLLTRALLVAGLSLTGMEFLVRGTLEETLLLAESPPPPASDWGATLKGNPYLLWEYAPGLREEGGHSVAINSLGMRGGEWVVPKPPGIRRLLSTGDSSVYGFGVADRAVFLEVAANLLQEGGSPVEAVNAAIPGYSTYQSRNLLEMRGLALEPDVVELRGNSCLAPSASVDRKLCTPSSSPRHCRSFGRLTRDLRDCMFRAFEGNPESAAPVSCW